MDTVLADAIGYSGTRTCCARLYNLLLLYAMSAAYDAYGGSAMASRVACRRQECGTWCVSIAGQMSDKFILT